MHALHQIERARERCGRNAGREQASGRSVCQLFFRPVRKQRVDCRLRRQAFIEIEQELRTQYLITYTSTNKVRDGSYRQIKLEVVDPLLQKEKLKLRYRPGYFARPLPPAN